MRQPDARRKPSDWLAVEEAALDPARLPRVVAGLGFSGVFGPVPRGLLPEFAPVYQRHQRTAQRLAASNTRAGAGVGRWDLRTMARWSVQDWRDRAALGEINRGLFLRPVRLLVAGRRGFLLDEYSGEWQDHTGGACGERLLDLAALMLGLPFGRAAGQVARLCGMAAVPVMPAAKIAPGQRGWLDA